MVLYDYDANYILVEQLKDKKVETLTAALVKTHRQFINNRHNTELYILDNEYFAN